MGSQHVSLRAQTIPGSEAVSLVTDPGKTRLTAFGAAVVTSMLPLAAVAALTRGLVPSGALVLLVALVAWSGVGALRGRSSKFMLTRRALQRTFRDMPFEVELEAMNRSRRRVRLHLRDILPEGVRVVSGTPEAILSVAAQETSKVSYSLQAPSRGTIVLDRVEARILYPSGFFESRVECSLPLTTRVGPAVEGFKEGDVLYRRAQLPSNSRITARGPGYGFDGLRAFSRDDPVSSIDWKASSRLTRMIVKMTHDEALSTVHFFLDCSPVEHGQSRLDDMVELAVRLATSLSRLGHPVAVGAFNNARLLSYIPPAVRKPPSLLQAFSEIPPGPNRLLDGGRDWRGGMRRILPFFGRGSRSSVVGTKGIHEVLRRIVAGRSKSSLVLLLTDLEGADEGFEQALTLMLKRGHRPVVLSACLPEDHHASEHTSAEREALICRLERMGVSVISSESGPPTILSRFSRMLASTP